VELTFTTILEEHAHGRATILLVRVPDEESDLLDDLPIPRGGFGSIKVDATIGKTSWRTSVFPDRHGFLLLIARHRAKVEALEVGKPVLVSLTVLS